MRPGSDAAPAYSSCLSPALTPVLAEYETRQAEEDALMARLPAHEIGQRRDDFLLSVGGATGVLLNLIVRESRARSILELGTAAGYSTLWLADAANATGGRVTTVDISPAKHSQAKAALTRAQLLQVVDLRTQDAFEFLATTSERYDFVLVDLWKQAYIPAIDALLDHLTPGATVVSDNMLEPPMVRWTAWQYQQHLRTIPDLDTVLLPIGSGLAISRFRVAQSTASASRGAAMR